MRAKTTVLTSTENVGDRRPATVDAAADPYLPLQMLTRYAGLSVRTLRNYLRHPVTPLPHYRVGGRILVRRSEFDEWAVRFRTEGSPLDEFVREALESGNR